jgi:NAD(P)-dependent dehydrogenase (short-subunit alcohol dehydrogenase family)
MRHPDQDGPALVGRAAETGVELTIQQLDITDDASVTETFQRAGEVDLLVNNANVGNYSSSSRRARWTIGASIVDTNLLGTVRCMQAVLPGMRHRRSGCIINVTTAAVPVAFPGSGAYAASKAAIEQVSEIAAIENRPHGARIVVVEPGVMLTNPRRIGAPPPADSPYLSTMPQPGGFLTANAPYACRAAVVAATIARAARDPDTPFRVLTGQAAPEIVALRRGHSGAEWHDLLSSPRFADTYQPPEPNRT